MRASETVFKAFAETAARWPARGFLNVLPETAQIYGIEAGEISYEQARDMVVRHADDIAAAGYREGQRVMLLMENRPAYFIWWLALNKLGISVVPVNPDLRAAELAYMIGHAEPVLAIATGDRRQAGRACGGGGGGRHHDAGDLCGRSAARAAR